MQNLNYYDKKIKAAASTLFSYNRGRILFVLVATSTTETSSGQQQVVNPLPDRLTARLCKRQAVGLQLRKQHDKALGKLGCIL